MSCQLGESANTPGSTTTDIPIEIRTITPSGFPTNTIQADESQTPTGTAPVQGIPRYPSGSKVEISLSGPESSGLDPDMNPFALQVDVILISPDGNSMTLPAFYDGDGQGGLDGNVWKARLLPNQIGTWHYEVASEDSSLDRSSGSFEVFSNNTCNIEAENEDLYCKGYLQHLGGYYLQFQNGESWLKAGLDDPENFLGTAFGDWKAKRDQIDELSRLGINSIYVITNNIDGDRKDTWPWYGGTESQAKANPDRFDVAKLQAWEDFFTYTQMKGIVLHFVFNDDSAWRGYDEYLYIREMIARFGHHPGMIWNVGEEANEIFTDAEQFDFAAMIRDLDPNAHPVTVHRKAPWPFLGDQEFDSASIQVGDGGADFSRTNLVDYNSIVREHRERSDQRGHPIPIMIDETPRITEVNLDVSTKFRTQVLYPIFLGGGNFELHYRDVYGQSGSVSIEDLEPLIMDMVRLRRFLEQLPYPDMQPCNYLLAHQENLCFGEMGSVYVIYLPYGGAEEINLSGMDGIFEGTWIDPKNGNIFPADSYEGGGLSAFSAPDGEDWVLFLMKK
jgi:hypothetical protein